MDSFMLIASHIEQKPTKIYKYLTLGQCGKGYNKHLIIKLWGG